MRKNMRNFAVAFALAGLLLTITGCGSGSGSGPTPVNDFVIVPGTASVPVGQMGQFTAFLNGVSTTATWTTTGGTIDANGVLTAPAMPTSVTVTATSGSNTGSTTVQIVAAQTLAVNPAALAIPAGGIQTFTATPSAGVAWSVNGLAGGDCVAPRPSATTQCHGTIDGNGNYTAPLSPPTGGLVTISATAGGNTGTAAATVQFSAASLTNNGANGLYAFTLTGVDFTAGNPLDIAGSVTISGSPASSTGTITGGVVDINSGTVGLAAQTAITGGTFQVGALDGRTVMTVTTASANLPSLTLQVTLISNQHALLIDFDNFATGSGTMDAEDPSSFATLLNGRFAFQFSGIDMNFFPVAVAGTFLANNNSIPINANGTPVNTQDVVYGALTTPVNVNDLTLSGSYTAADPALGRGTITMSSTFLGTVNFAYYMIDQTHLKIVEIDPTLPFVLQGEVFASPATTTPLTGGTVFTTGGSANNSPFAGGGTVLISAGSVSSGVMDGNNGGSGFTQSGLAISSGTYTNSVGAGFVPARFQLSLTTTKATSLFSAYTFKTAAGLTGAELVEIDTNNNVNGVTGTAYQQGAVGPVQGSFALNLSGIANAKSSNAFEQDLTGQIGLATNSTTVTGTLDVNNGGAFPGLTVTSTSTLNAVAPNGRGTAQIIAKGNGSETFNLVYYLIDANTALLLDSDGSFVANGQMARQF